jgi:phage I-like protein
MTDLIASICAVLKEGDAPDWIELIPKGTFVARDDGKRFNNADPQAVIAATNSLNLTAGLPIDYDHATDFAAPEGRPAPAAGWIKELQVRGGSIWGRVDWTEKAAASIAAKEYRYISPVFQHSKTDGVVRRLLRAGLTNNPKLELTAIAARSDAMTEAELKEARERIAKLFGLDANATITEICAAADKVKIVAAGTETKTGAETEVDSDALIATLVASGKVVKTEDYTKLVTDVNSMKADRLREQATAKVEAAIKEGKLPPAQREWAVAYCASDVKGFDAFIAKQSPVLSGVDQTFNGQPRASESGLTSNEMAVCSMLTKVSAKDFAAQKGKRLNLGILSQKGAKDDEGKDASK